MYDEAACGLTLQTLYRIAFSVAEKWKHLSTLQLKKPYVYIQTYYI